MNGQQIIKCPRCGGNKVSKLQLGSFFLILSVLFFITVIGIPIAIGLFVYWLISKKKYERTFVCQECKHNFQVSDEVRLRYQAVIQQNESFFK